MDKYAECNIVDTVSTPKKVKSEKRKNRAPIIRFIVAAAIVGVFCAVRYVPYKPLERAQSFLHTVFCYDVFGRSDFGETPVVSEFIELINEKTQD